MVNLLWILPLTAIGFFISLYIIISKKRKGPMVCVIGEGQTCNDVVNSKYNKLFGFPNEILGLLYYTLVAVLVIMLSSGIPSIANISVLAILIVIAIPAVIFSFYLTYVQWKILKQWCEYCVTSAIATILIFVLEII